ncbi:MAG: response regulator [Bacteroidota bacterium]
MNQHFNCIMLVDDNRDDNFYHEREIKKNDPATIVITETTGSEALEYLRSRKENNKIRPDLIFLDINMPGMSGWEFLNEYEGLDKDEQSKVIIIMLTTSDYSDDKDKSKAYSVVSGYTIKPLTKDKLKDIYSKFLTE